MRQTRRSSNPAFRLLQALGLVSSQADMPRCLDALAEQGVPALEAAAGSLHTLAGDGGASGLAAAVAQELVTVHPALAAALLRYAVKERHFKLVPLLLAAGVPAAALHEGR